MSNENLLKQVAVFSEWADKAFDLLWRLQKDKQLINYFIVEENAELFSTLLKGLGNDQLDLDFFEKIEAELQHIKSYECCNLSARVKP